jgi:hypothetical protein
MKLHILDADVDAYRPIYYTNNDDMFEFDRSFDGRSMQKVWNAQHKFAFVPRFLLKGDTPGYMTHIPVFSPEAVQALAHFLEPNGELLPIICDEESYFVYNVTRVIDALDEAKSEIERYDSGNIMDILRFSFFPEKIGRTTVFKVPQCILTDVFVTELFVKSAQEAKLKGFKFRLVWSSD